MDRIETRFWKRINKTESCWLWIAGKSTAGYGRISLRKGFSVYSHRYSWELHNGPITKGLNVLHHCDIPACVKPDHLFLGNQKDNTLDRVSKQRKFPTELRKDSKLTWPIVFLIRLLSPMWSLSQLASRFSVSQHCIFKVIHGETWRSNHAYC